jgi:hypothetical protein
MGDVGTENVEVKSHEDAREAIEEIEGIRPTISEGLGGLTY